MTAILQPFRAIRENLRMIGVAVSASREFSRAGETHSDTQVSSSGIPF